MYVLMQKAMGFWCMSKDDAVNIMDGSNLVDKRGVL